MGISTLSFIVSSTDFIPVSYTHLDVYKRQVSLSGVMESFREVFNWSLFAFGPGHGIELSNGRLLIPVWLANGEENHHWPTQLSTIVSDDGGKTWQRGDIIYGSENTADPFAWPNETQAVQLSDDSVMLNIRHNGSDHFRYVSVSPNGKDNFSAPKPDISLPDPICFEV